MPTFFSRFTLRNLQYFLLIVLFFFISACGGVEEIVPPDEDNSNEQISQTITSIEQVAEKVWDYNGEDAGDSPTYVTVSSEGRLWRNERRATQDSSDTGFCYERINFIGSLVPGTNGAFQFIEATSNNTLQIFISSGALFIESAQSPKIFPASSLNFSQLGPRCSASPTDPAPPPGGNPGNPVIDFSAFSGNWLSRGGEIFGFNATAADDFGLVQFTSDGKYTVYNDLGDRYDSIASCYLPVAAGTIITDGDAYLKVDGKDGSLTPVSFSRSANALTVSSRANSETYTLDTQDAQALTICQGDAEIAENNTSIDSLQSIAGVWNYSLRLRDGSEYTRFVSFNTDRELVVLELLAGDGVGEACYNVAQEIGRFDPLDSNSLSWLEFDPPAGAKDDSSAASGFLYLLGETLLITTESYTRTLEKSELDPNAFVPLCGGGGDISGIPAGARPVNNIEGITGLWQVARGRPQAEDSYIDIDEHGYVSRYDFVDFTVDIPCYATQIDLGIIREDETTEERDLIYITAQERVEFQLFSSEGKLYSATPPFASSQGLVKTPLTADSLSPLCTPPPQAPANAMPVGNISEVQGVWDISSTDNDTSADSIYLGISDDGQLAHLVANADAADECFIFRNLQKSLRLQGNNIFVLPQDNGFSIRVKIFRVENSLTLIGKQSAELFDIADVPVQNNLTIATYPQITADPATISPRCPSIDSLPAERILLSQLNELSGLWDDSLTNDNGSRIIRYLGINEGGNISRYTEQSVGDSSEICYDDMLNIGSLAETQANSFIVDFVDQRRFRNQEMQAFLIANDLVFANEERVLRYPPTQIQPQDIDPICVPSGLPDDSIPVTALNQIANIVYGPPPDDRPAGRLQFFTIDETGAYTLYQSIGVNENRCFIEQANADQIQRISTNNFSWERRGVTKLYRSPEGNLVIVDADKRIEIAEPSPEGQSAYQPLCADI